MISFTIPAITDLQKTLAKEGPTIFARPVEIDHFSYDEQRIWHHDRSSLVLLPLTN